MTESQERGPFICPECGSHQCGIVSMVSRRPEIVPVTQKVDPWSEVLQIHTCADCGSDIPAHLSERWSGISIEEAQQQWQEVYREKRG